MLLYNHFADMLPVSVWTVVWMYVSLIMQPVSQQDATERVGQALFTIADALNVPDNLAATRDLMATLSTAPANAAARHFCSTIQEGQGDAPAQPPPQAHISPLAAFNFGVQSWPTAPQLVPLPVSMPPMLMAVSMPADAGITCPPNKGMYYAGVTVWDILRNPSMPPVQRRDVALLLLQEYGHTAGQATPTMVHLPVAQQALNIQAGSEECSEACAFTAVWLAPVNVPALLAAAEAGGVHGQVPATSPVLSDYAPRIRIKGLGRALTAAWAVRAFKAGYVYSHPHRQTPSNASPIPLQNLVEHILRTRIYDSFYWKAHCFALSAETLLEKAVELKFVGGIINAAAKPAPFLCLILKLLQIQPDKDIVIAYIEQTDFKYVRALGAFYLRLVGSAQDVYTYLEPLLADWRKLAARTPYKSYILHMDEFVDSLLTEESVFGVNLPHILKRPALEAAGKLEPRVSPLQDHLDAAAAAASSELAADSTKHGDTGRRQRSRSPPPSRAKQNNRGEISLTVDQWNAQRAKLGIKPLR
ncbi:Prp38 [Symbiodinium sp. KB8]|nr:Prp38 [Symbiodinium sp. KB8]